MNISKKEHFDYLAYCCKLAVLLYGEDNPTVYDAMCMLFVLSAKMVCVPFDQVIKSKVH